MARLTLDANIPIHAFRDAMLPATAGAARCTALITEDMAPGASLAGVTILPAFAGNAISPEAAALLG